MKLQCICRGQQRKRDSLARQQSPDHTDAHNAIEQNNNPRSDQRHRSILRSKCANQASSDQRGSNGRGLGAATTHGRIRCTLPGIRQPGSRSMVLHPGAPQNTGHPPPNNKYHSAVPWIPDKHIAAHTCSSGSNSPQVTKQQPRNTNVVQPHKQTAGFHRQTPPKWFILLVCKNRERSASNTSPRTRTSPPGTPPPAKKQANHPNHDDEEEEDSDPYDDGTDWTKVASSSFHQPPSPKQSKDNDTKPPARQPPTCATVAIWCETATSWDSLGPLWCRSTRRRQRSARRRRRWRWRTSWTTTATFRGRDGLNSLWGQSLQDLCARVHQEVEHDGIVWTNDC